MKTDTPDTHIQEAQIESAEKGVRRRARNKRKAESRRRRGKKQKGSGKGSPTDD